MNYVPGLIRLSGMEEELTRIFQRKADIRTIEDLSPYFRQNVINTAEVAILDDFSSTPAYVYSEQSQ